MTFARWAAASTLALALSGCGQVVMPDATSDGAQQDAVDAAALDVIDVIDAIDVIADRAEDAADADVSPSAPDGEPPSDACAPPAGDRPERTLRSCTGPNGAPSEHCREVWACGGLTQIGSTAAWAQGYMQPDPVRQRTTCEVARVHVNPGFIDAYEVSVARFRAWVRAGMPQPAENQRLFLNRDFTWSRQRFDVPNYSCRRRPECTTPDPAQCTYSDVPSSRDELPINCLSTGMMVAFCWWEGKHLANEGLWEHVATNGGRTPLPFSDRAPSPFDPCRFGDVAGCSRIDQLPAPINAHPLGQSASPAGVFGLWGGLREQTISLGRAPPLGCLSDLQDEGHGIAHAPAHGRSYRDTRTAASQFDHSATWVDAVWNNDRDPGLGFRCARWAPEPWE